MSGITLELQEGLLHGILGANGSGHDLLLHLLSLLEPPDGGGIEVFGQRIPDQDVEVRSALRNTIFGYVFPNPCLLPGMTVAENIAMPLFRFAEASEESATLRVSELLETFDLDEIGNYEATSLPMDIQHPVALCRALVHRPRILAIVDPARARTLMPLVRIAVERFGITAIWSSSDRVISPALHRELTLDRGRVSAERVSFS